MKEPRVILFALECHGLSNAKLNDDTLLVLFDDAKPLVIKEVFEHQNKELIISSYNGFYSTSYYCTAGLAVAAKHGSIFNWIGYVGGLKPSIDPVIWIPHRKRYEISLLGVEAARKKITLDCAYAFYRYCHPNAAITDLKPRQ